MEDVLFRTFESDDFLLMSNLLNADGTISFGPNNNFRSRWLWFWKFCLPLDEGLATGYYELPFEQNAKRQQIGAKLKKTVIMKRST